jgi:hypothetical protein
MGRFPQGKKQYRIWDAKLAYFPKRNISFVTIIYIWD